MSLVWRSIFISYFLIHSPVISQDSLDIKHLEQRISDLEKKLEQEDLKNLREEAAKTAGRPSKDEESKIFKGGERALQALNPEISVAMDAFGQLIFNDDYFTEEVRSGADFRVAELQFQSTLDPFSTTKVIIEFKREEVEFAEAYLTWNQIINNVSLTAGKFRQQFGVVNRWHAHGLDQYDFPLALQTILGKEGLNQIGLSVEWLIPPLLADANELIIQLTNAQNDHLFAGDFYSFPSALTRLKNFYDLSPAAYLEFGITGMFGKNNNRGFDENRVKILESTRWTKLAGFDLTFLWEPVRQAKYRSFMWRSELYYVDKEPNITAYGGYTYVEYKLGLQWLAGIRFDYTQPFEQENEDRYIYQLVPYVTWWQSPWVRLRFQVNFADGKGINKIDSVARIQITWAIGPHKHERY